MDLDKEKILSNTYPHDLADFENNINKAYKYLPPPFKEFNERSGKEIYHELFYKPKPENYYKEESDDSPATLHAKKELLSKSNETKSILILHFANDVKELCEHFLSKDLRSFIISKSYFHIFYNLW